MDVEAAMKTLQAIWNNQILRSDILIHPGDFHVNVFFRLLEVILQVAGIRKSFLKLSYVISDCNWTRTHNHLVHKRTLNHLAKLANHL